RFDVLVANPIATLETIADSTQVETPSNAYSTQDDPFTLLHQLQEQWLPHVAVRKEWDLPFVGGALGYFRYDLGRRVETMREV
ncbi:aminodeoxychorismate synthase component I, partial [Escherichia coli]|nr:aminodeoxychorismate synthase component I [Escherichia coli]